MRWLYIFAILCIVLACGSIGCSSSHPEEPEGPVIFELLDSSRTGLEFVNRLTPTKDFNVFHYMYFYNGGGVAVADFNNDGLEDIFFTANQASNALYLNNGDLKFRDVTAEAGLEGAEGWTSGVTAVDINQDGLMDLYVNQLGDYRNIHGHNQLYLCTGINENGVPVFREAAAEYGLDIVGFGTQACFFDYDLDGDLDMYQLNHSVHNNGTFGQRKVFIGTYHETAGDRMFRNDDGKFTDVTKECGIHSSVIGYGLGVSCSDINLDGWPDLYICNDFHENDYLYINGQDGTFREILNEQIRHTSRFAMGVDIADINNDGYNEIFTLDMHPYDPHILKSSLGEDGYGTFQFKLGYGYNYQYARNMLQLNNRDQTYSEIGLFAGVYATDWSWAALFLDFDHDGYKDLFVSNGIPRRMNDIDYVNFLSNDEVQWRIKTDNMEDADIALEEKMPEIRIPNKFFRNTGVLAFDELSIRNDRAGFSNGAAYADFDNDGDLDIVVNNIGSKPYFYRNLTCDAQSEQLAYLHLRLKGSPKNREAIGARVIVYKGPERLVEENFPATGYQSSVQSGIHLGLGNLTDVDSMILIWPDRTFQHLDKGHCNRQTEVAWKSGLPVFDFSRLHIPDTGRVEVTDVTSAVGIDYVHHENPFVEFDREVLIPHMTSSEGPPLAVGDVNGDGRVDIYIGASKWKIPGLFLQQADGSFRASHQEAFVRDSVHEDVDAVFADFDGDGDQDLIVASGGNEWRDHAEALTQRFYFNNGEGVFVRDTSVFSGTYMTAACVAINDFDQDGDIDVFMGGRAVPWNYGVIPESLLWKNDGTGHFRDATDEVCPRLRKCGLAKDAKWADLNNDGWPDLLVAVEWGPIQIYINRQGTLIQHPLEGTNGLWNFVDVADLDGDGDMDIVAGNLGLNSKLRPSQEKPLRLYIRDFDDNGQIEQILTYYIHDHEIVFPTYAEVTRQLPQIKKSYLFARDFADASIADLVGTDQVNKADVLEVYVTENSWFENRGDFVFERHALPERMQFAPLQAALIKDFDGDGSLDVMAMGNYYESNIEMGRYDADYGNILFNEGRGLNNGRLQSLKIPGQVRDIASVHTGDDDLVIIARNDAPVLVLKVRQAAPDL